jgi:hypothetical protein
MANICSTEYKISGETKYVEMFHNLLNHLGAYQHSLPLNKLSEYFNLNQKFGGHIVDVSFDKNEKILTIRTETPWRGQHLLFHIINILYGEHFYISYREIEEGCEVFNVYNEDYMFYDEECVVYANGELFDYFWEEYFDTIDDAISYWCEKMNFDNTTKTADEMINYINNYQYDEEETYFRIYEFNFL